MPRPLHEYFMSILLGMKSALFSFEINLPLPLLTGVPLSVAKGVPFYLSNKCPLLL